MKTIEKISLKKILLDGKIKTKMDVEKELKFLKNNFEKTIENKYSLILSYFYFLCFLIFLSVFFHDRPTDEMILLSNLIIWMIIYPLIWLSQIRKFRKNTLVKKVQLAGEYFWYCIFFTILFLILQLIFIIITFTNFKTVLNIWYIYGIVGITVLLLCYGIKRLSVKIAKIYDPEWFE